MKSKDTFCSYCGNIFNPNQIYPKVCLSCANITYNNPLAVTATVIPVIDYLNDNRHGVLVVKRNIEPKKGQWALPGGFLEQGESWKEGAAREVFEETGLDLNNNEFGLLSVETASNGNLIILCDCGAINLSEIDFHSNEEVTEIKVIYEFEELAFPTHTEALRLMLMPE
jgi:8-oxo-dGTP pyrophosphatase MutT (NUDIX family)